MVCANMGTQRGKGTPQQVHRPVLGRGSEGLETPASSPSQKTLADVFEAIGDAVYAMDRRERILFANRRALELWGKAADAVVGHRLLEVFPGIEEGEPYRAYRSVLASGRPMHLETVAPALGGRWIGLDVRPGPRGGLVVVFRDIDDRKRAEAALRASEERFRSMLEALPQMAYVVEPGGVALYYNRQFREYTGVATPSDPDVRLAMLHPEDRARLFAARAEGSAIGREFTVEVRIRRHDGAYRWHRIHNRPLHYEGQLTHWLGTAVDIDDIRHANELLEARVAERTAELEAANRRLATQIEEREQAEARLRQAQRTEAIGQLTAGIAHDFNNLLTSIMGNIELLEGRLRNADERTSRLLAGALAAAERGASLTAQLLAFSRQQRMNPEPVDLNQVVSGVASLLHSTIGASIRIELVPARGLWRTLADIAQLELVLLNLAINARDAMPHGGTITIATGNATLGPPDRPEEPPPGDYAMVSVADTGGGIPSEILGKVFDPFFTTKEVGKGSGLGLSQVLGVAQQLGGGVRIETELGAGTTVQVILPRLDPKTVGKPVPAASDERRLEQPVRRTGGILLVDDDADVRAVAAAMLLDADHIVIEAESGSAALECLGRGEPHIDLLIADLAMPGMSGSELARTARLSRPELPVLFISGFADLAAQDEGIGEAVLQKPFHADELAARVAEALSRPAGLPTLPSAPVPPRRLAEPRPER
jgi:PAS domain S-box-containing protein